MWVNPIVFYSVLQNSTTDWFYEFNENTLFFNIVIPVNWIEDRHVIVKFVRKGKAGVLFLNEIDRAEFSMERLLLEHYKFTETDDLNSAPEPPSSSLNIPEDSRGHTSSVRILK